MVHTVGYLFFTMLFPLLSLYVSLRADALKTRTGVEIPASRVYIIITIASAAMALCIALVGFGFRCAGLDWFPVSFSLMVVSFIFGWFSPFWFAKEYQGLCGLALRSARGTRPMPTWAIWVSRLFYVASCSVVVYLMIS